MSKRRALHGEQTKAVEVQFDCILKLGFTLSRLVTNDIFKLSSNVTPHTPRLIQPILRVSNTRTGHMTTRVSTSFLHHQFESNLLRYSRPTPLNNISVALAIIEDNTIAAHVRPNALRWLGQLEAGIVRHAVVAVAAEVRA